MAKYLDLDGLRRVWEKTKALVSEVSNGSLIVKLQTTDTGGGNR